MNRADALELLDEEFRALSRGQETIDALSAIIVAKGEFSACTWPQRHCAFDMLHRLYEGGNQLARDALQRLINLH